MTSNLESLASQAAFHDAFAGALRHLIERTPTPSILLMAGANAVAIKDAQLISQIETRYLALASAFAGTSEDSRVLSVAMAGGLASKQSTQRVVDGVWRLHTNVFRASRPARQSSGIATTVELPFDPSGFHFGRVPHEVYWKGDIGSVTARLIFSKYPLTAYHSLLVPDLEQMLPQVLLRKYHRFAIQALGQLPRGTIIGYNSLGASASVNQLHFQVVVGARPQPFESPAWDSEPYPAPFKAFNNEADSWEFIHGLHSANQPYNIVYLRGEVIVWPRRFQGTFETADWTSAPAWYELTGNFSIDNASRLEAVTGEMIKDLLRRVSLG